jgi:hypothetical protein
MSVAHARMPVSIAASGEFALRLVYSKVVPHGSTLLA